jgi:5-methylcytosine-specific restriction protein A
MSIADITREAVLGAVREYDRIGQEQFLEKYRRGKDRGYALIHQGRRYESKAIVCAAHSFLPGEEPLQNFSGGLDTVHRKLTQLGFEVTVPERQATMSAEPGEILSNAELVERFGVGNMGGMRRNKGRKHLVLISDPTKALYDDRWEGEILHYTGMGKKGDQQLGSQNRTLAESGRSGEVVHLFEVFVPKEYVYAGQVELAAEPYREIQLDDEGESRQVWMFPLRLKEDFDRPVPIREQIVGITTRREKRLAKLSTDQLQARAAAARRKPAKRQVESQVIQRDAAVAQFVKRLAGGVCELCGGSAPFNSQDGQPYLECHHIIHLADGGDDAIDNAVALCPNCHRKMHVLGRSEDIKALESRVRKRND